MRMGAVLLLSVECGWLKMAAVAVKVALISPFICPQRAAVKRGLYK